jgi:predicted RNA-binding protein (virulence factor B family)
MIKIGQYNILRITRFTDHGAYLDAGKELGDILLPKQYVKPEMRPGTEVEVIVYLDQQDRLVATTEKALAVVGDFAHLRVAWVNEYGAFLDWGLMKDLFVPFREQKLRMVKDHSYTVHVHIDPETARIVASAKVERYLQSANFTDYHKGEEVDMLI